MPNIHHSMPGRYIAGTHGDGGIISLNKDPIFPPSGSAGGNPDMNGPDYVTAMEVLCKYYGPVSERLVAVDIASRQHRTLYVGTFSDFCGGGGRWCLIVLVDGKPDGTVLFGDGSNGNAHVYHQDIAPIAFGPDGTFAYKRWWQDGLKICPAGQKPNPDSDVELVPTNTRVDDVRLYPGGGCLYRVGDGNKPGREIRGYNLPWFSGRLTLPYECHWVRAAQDGGRALMLLQNGRLVSFYADNPTKGWVIQGPGLDSFRPAVGMLGDGRVLFVWSTVQGDPPHAIQALTKSLSEPMVSFDIASPVPTPEPTPIPTPNPPPTPEPPMSLQAPDKLKEIKAVFAAHPEIDTKTDNDATRGKIVDWCCYELNGKVQRGQPWGRKARNKDGSNKNGDALTFLRDDGKFEIYDIINGADGKAMWGKPSRPLNQGENGYWTPADPVDVSEPHPEPEPEPEPEPTPPPPPSDLREQVRALAELVTELAKSNEQAHTAADKAHQMASDAVAAANRAVQRGAAVEVTGSVSYMDAIRSREVTWTGKVK